jgi:hypothetical protein
VLSALAGAGTVEGGRTAAGDDAHGPGGPGLVFQRQGQVWQDQAGWDHPAGVGNRSEETT